MVRFAYVDRNILKYSVSVQYVEFVRISTKQYAKLCTVRIHYMGEQYRTGTPSRSVRVRTGTQKIFAATRSLLVQCGGAAYQCARTGTLN